MATRTVRRRMRGPADPTVTLGRHPERAVTDRQVVDDVLDSELTCHVAFTVDGWPYAVPTVHARDGDRLLIHGSSLSRMTATLASGIPVCVTVTELNGIVAARSAFNHSINYRSVMVFGVAVRLDDAEAQLSALKTIVEHVLPGRWDEVRPPTRQELKATAVLSLPIDRVTAKVRRGGPVDAPVDRHARVWCGVLPVRRTWAAPELVPEDVADLATPASVIAALERPAR
jgi:nitroimidazol reductase NimA-like FMN-containing flavoprotein (pyridoxamine 5'-phosphate oxidase superfamily)